MVYLEKIVSVSGIGLRTENLKEFVGPKGSIRIIHKKDRQTHQEEGDLIEYYKYPEKNYEVINIYSKRKPTDKQSDYLINMIENGIRSNPMIDKLFDCFQVALVADRKIREGLI